MIPVDGGCRAAADGRGARPEATSNAEKGLAAAQAATADRLAGGEALAAPISREAPQQLSDAADTNLEHLQGRDGGYRAAVVREALRGNMYSARYRRSKDGGPEWRVLECRELAGVEGGTPIVASILPSGARAEGVHRRSCGRWPFGLKSDRAATRANSRIETRGVHSKMRPPGWTACFIRSYGRQTSRGPPIDRCARQTR